MDARRTNEQAERLQRVRIGLTGLAAVFLVVAAAGVLTQSASEERPVPLPTGTPAPANLAAEPQEPLAELGVAPSQDPVPNAQAPGSAPR